MASIESAQLLHLERKDGQAIVGLVRTYNGKLEVAGKETSPISAAKQAVIAV